MSAPAPATDPLIGQLAGSYRIEDVVGAGGMGKVYRAAHPTLGRDAAVKVLALALTSDAELVRRFRQEALAVARLQHPNIVEVLDFGTLADGRPFYTMELLRGESLARFLARTGKVGLETVVAVLDPVLAALEAAHAAGIIHRDLKPENVFLCARDGGCVPKLLDFGVAKLVDPLAGGVVPHTQTGSLLGTPTYMSPEQASGQTSKIGPPSDIYAVGVMAYEMLTGRPPFQAAHLGELIHKHLAEAPPRVRTLRPDLPDDVDALLEMALAKDPAARPQSASAMRRALRSLAQPQPGTVVEFGTPVPRVAHGTPPRAGGDDDLEVVPASAPPPRPPPERVAEPTTHDRHLAGPALAVTAALLALAAVAVVLVRQRNAPRAAAPSPAPAPLPTVQAIVTPDAAPAQRAPSPSPSPSPSPPPPRTHARAASVDAGPPAAPLHGEPADVSRLKKEAKEAAALQDYDLAYARAVQAADAVPDDQEAIFLAGHASCFRGHADDAKRWYGKLNDPRMKDALDDNCSRFKQIYLTPDSANSPAARSGRAMELYPKAVDLMATDPAKALEMAKQIIQLQPSFEGGYLVAAGASCRLEKPDDVKRYLPRVPPRLRDLVKMQCDAAKVPFPDLPDAGP